MQSSQTTSTHDHDRTALQLGIVCAFNKRTHEFAKLLLHINLDRIQEASGPDFEKLLALNPTWTKERLGSWEKDGKSALARGVARSVHLLKYSPFPGVVFHVLPPTDMENWELFEHTISTKVLEDYNRHKVFATSNENSCGADVVLCAGLCSRAVWRRGDAMALSSWKTKSKAIFRLILQQPWGTLQQEQRDQRRDCWRASLDVDLGIYSRDDGQADVSDLLEQSFDGLRTYSYSGCRAIICDSDHLRIPKHTTQMWYTCMHVSLKETDHRGVGDYISDKFAPTKPPGLGSTCEEKDCSLQAKSFRLVLDRLPPCLVVVLEGEVVFNSEAAAKRNVLNDIVVVHRSVTGRLHKTTYAVEGMILRRAGDPAHFVLRWRRKNEESGNVETIHYDGIIDAWGRGIPNLSSDLEGRHTIRVLFYKRTKGKARRK